MKGNQVLVLGVTLLFAAVAHAAEPAANAKNPAPAPASTSGPVFDDKIVAHGKGVEIRSHDLEEAFLAVKANKAATGQDIPPGTEEQVEKELLDRMIATQLFLARATVADKTAGKELAQKFIRDTKNQSTSEEAFKRQLTALGLTEKVFETQVGEQAVVKIVIDRELKTKDLVTLPEIKKFYEENPKLFEQPEQVRVAHILFSSKDLNADQMREKKAEAQKVLERAQKGEDFTKLVKEFSQDEPSKAQDGIYLVTRGQFAPEFESAAFTMKENQISDVVTTRYGYHIVKLLEKIPAHQQELEKVQDKIRDSLMQQAVQKQLPDYIEKLRKEAGVEVVSNL